jgi:hypothetical protein
LSAVVRSRTCPAAIRTRKGLHRFIAGAAGAQNKPRWGISAQAAARTAAQAEVQASRAQWKSEIDAKGAGENFG